jgi:hypothetical protein
VRIYDKGATPAGTLGRMLTTVHNKIIVFYDMGPLERSKQQKMDMRVLEPGMLDLEKIL